MKQPRETPAGLSAQNQALMSLLAHGFSIITILRKGQVLLPSKLQTPRLLHVVPATSSRVPLSRCLEL